ncbi:MAG: glycosyltransferase family 4 protein [Candidatus Zixiibacteriota bacterium]|nr:MAG: glycosyltransferase family 4 protein [candidate division Zixibacteria bacterium]
MSEKYVLHFGSVTGMPFQYARAGRLAGINSANVIVVDRDSGKLRRQLPFDRALASPLDGLLHRAYKKAEFFLADVLPNTALVHYHSDSIFRKYLDCALLWAFSRPMVISFAGTDVRLESIARKHNPYVYIPSYSAGEKKIRRKLTWISKFIRYAATDYELAEYVQPYFDKVYYLPQPIDTSAFTCRLPAGDTAVPTVIHIPTNREVKGTAYIEAAVERLRSEGLKFSFKLLDCNLTQEQVKEEIAGADIVANEIRTGAFGVFAVEAMASGKPNISYIRDDLLEKYPAELPIVSANPDTVYPVLKKLITDADLRTEIGRKGRAYVEKYHSLEAVSATLKEIYCEVGLPC